MRSLCVCRPAIFPALALLLLLSPAATARGALAAGARRDGEHRYNNYGDIYSGYGSMPPSPSMLFAPLAWLRSSFCQFLYGTSDSATCGGGRGGLSDSDDLSRHPPWERVARSPRYGKQTVVRFRITTADEEAALAAAAMRLFLDVWSFNNATGTVDIRLDKDGVAPLLSLLPASLQQAYTHLIPDLATAVWDTYPARGSGGRGRPAKPALMPSAASSRLTDASAESQQYVASLVGGGGGGGTDNIFFRDYQPYPVIVQWMRLLDVMFPFVNMVSVGETAEGREILGLRVGTLPRDGGDGDGDDGDGSDRDDGGESDARAMKKKKNKHSMKEGESHHKSKNAKKKKASAHNPRDSLSWGPEDPEYPGDPEDPENPENPEDPEDPEDPEEPGEPLPKRKTILVTGGMHAREWISSSSVSYVAWSIVSGYGKEHMITKLVDHFDLVFVPVVNPDGYEYTWQTDRLWRKTRQSTNFRYCRGFDLDHAFGFEWGSGDGESSARGARGAALGDEPCSETYGGESAFQAIEAQTLSSWARNEVERNNVQFVGFLDLHAYSQHILFPFSYSCATDPPNLENLEELAAGLAKAIRLSTGETYTVSSACEGVLGSAQQADTRAARARIEPGGGSAIDWFYHEMDAKFSYQIKLRDTGSYGFLLPSSEIVPTGEEVFSAVKYFGDFLLGNNGIEKAADGRDEPMRTELRRRTSWKA